jgi:hypothetical protein
MVKQGQQLMQQRRIGTHMATCSALNRVTTGLLLLDQEEEEGSRRRV